MKKNFQKSAILFGTKSNAYLQINHPIFGYFWLFLPIFRHLTCVRKIKFIFDDRRYDRDVYVTKICSDQQPKRIEPEKMSAWKSVTAEEYIDLAQLGSITDTHVRRYDQILEQIEQFEGKDQLDNWDEWNSWDNTNDPFTNEEWETK